MSARYVYYYYYYYLLLKLRQTGETAKQSHRRPIRIACDGTQTFYDEYYMVSAFYFQPRDVKETGNHVRDLLTMGRATCFEREFIILPFGRPLK